MKSITRAAARLLSGFARSQRGNVALIAGIALPVLLMISAGAIDLHHAAKVKSELQDALDAATLAAARSNYTAAGDIQRVGMASIRANMPQYFKDNPGDVATFTLGSRYQVQATATVQVKTIIANVFLPPYGKLFDDYLPMTASSDVLRASRNVEVAMALDITGSMDGYMNDLKSAAKELVGIVVQGDQTLYTTRVALVPYARGVNVGSYAEAFRGPLKGSTSITGASWAAAAKEISNSSNGTFTASSHGLAVGDAVYVYGFSSSSINRTIQTVSQVPTSSTFKLTGLSSSYSAASGTRRYLRKCVDPQCRMLVTSSGHGLINGGLVKVSGVQGMTQLNGYQTVTPINTNTFAVAIDRNNPPADYVRYGTVQCGWDGCQQRVFYNKSNVLTELPATDCISERPRGSSDPTDKAPGTNAWLGRSYLPSGQTCQPGRYLPLTNVLTGTNGLNTVIDNYQPLGATAGQTGIEMAWYSISPNFGSVLPTASRPNPFNTAETIKAVILMTDGEFNTPYCEGVVSKDAGSGSIGTDYQINCPSTNGDVFTQSVEVCRAMKKQGIVVYTIGFNLGTSKGKTGIDTAYEVMEACATDPKENFFPAATGTDLKEAFKQIGRDITRLRIAR